MDEERFWELIEDAWAAESEVASRRAALVGGDGDREAVAAIVQEACDVVVEELRTVLAELPKDELLAFDRILERKLYEILSSRGRRGADASRPRAAGRRRRRGGGEGAGARVERLGH